MEIPRAETLSHSSDDNERQRSPLRESPAGYPGGETLAGQYKVHRAVTEKSCGKEGRDLDSVGQTPENQDCPLDSAGVESGGRGGDGGSNSQNRVTPNGNDFAACSFRCGGERCS